MKRAITVLALLLLPALAHAEGRAYRMGFGLQLVPNAGEPTHDPANGTLYINSGASNALTYCNPAGTCVALGAGGGGGSGDMLLGTSQTVTAAKTFNVGTLKLNNAGATFATTLASGATANRTWTFPDATDTAVGLATVDTLLNKTLTAPVFGSSITGTYTLAGTPTLAASLSIGTTATYAIGDTTHLLTAVATAKIIGGSSNTSGHTVPNVADDTVALLAASQTLTNKTLTAPIINGATSASGNFDLSGSSGSQKSTTGAQTFGGSSYIYSAAYVDSLKIFSLIDAAGSGAATVTSAASSTTVGALIRFSHPVTITGIRAYYVGGSAKTLQCKVWDSANTLLETGTVAVNAAGSYVCPITPITVSSSNVYKRYTIGVWENSAALYTYVSNAPGRPTSSTCNTPYAQSPWVLVDDDCQYHAGDARPDLSIAGTSQYFPVEPIYTVP